MPEEDFQWISVNNKDVVVDGNRVEFIYLIENKPRTLSVNINKFSFRTLREHLVKNNELEGQFLLFKSPNSETVDTVVPAGEFQHNRVLANYLHENDPSRPYNLYHQIKEQVDKGFTFVGDFHNHPSGSAEIMIENGLPSSYGIGPSYNDINSLPENVKKDFNIDMVRIIGGIMDGKEVYGAYKVNNTNPTLDEINQFTFTGEVTGDEDFQIQHKYANPQKMIDMGIIEMCDVNIID